MHLLSRSQFPLALAIGMPIYLGVVVVLRSWLHSRRTGASPIVVSFNETVHGYIGKLLVFFSAGLVVDIAACAILGGDVDRIFPPIPWLMNDALGLVAIAALAISLPVITVAQSQMGPSFRIGIDERNRTDLVVRGLYRHSRNPIYVGMIAALVSVLLLLPNALTLLLVGAAVVLIQVQVRLEEDHLRGLHGERFEEYRRQVRRWL